MSDFLQGASGAVVIWLLNWISHQPFSVGSSFAVVVILLGLAWWLLKQRILRQMVKAIQTLEQWQAQPAQCLSFLARLGVVVFALFSALSVARLGIERYQVQKIAHGLSW